MKQEEETPSDWPRKRREALRSLDEVDWTEDSSVTVNLHPKPSSVPAPAKGLAHILGLIPAAWRGPIVLAIIAATVAGAKGLGWF